MLFPEMTKLLTRLTQFSVITAPPNPPKVGVRARNVSIFRVVVPLVFPTETSFTEWGKLLSENGGVAGTVPAESLYQVGVTVNVAEPGAAATEPVVGMLVR